jgi:hypothetical protein
MTRYIPTKDDIERIKEAAFSEAARTSRPAPFCWSPACASAHTSDRPT